MNTKEVVMDVEKMQITEEDDQQHKQSCIQPPLQYPWLLLPRMDQDEGYICCTSPLYRTYFKKFLTDLRIQDVFNCCYGWLILSNDDKRFFLWNPVKSRLVQLPPLELKEKQHIEHAVLSAPSSKETGDDLDPNCMVMLFQRDNGRFCIRYCLLREKEKHWESVCYPSGTYFLRRPTIFNDAVYALRGMSEVVCISHVDQTGIVATSYVGLPKVSLSVLPTQQHLVESCGELFYIVIHWADYCSEEDIAAIEAFKLDQVSMTWNKVVEVDDRVFLFNRNYCISSCAATKEGYIGYVSYLNCCLYSYNIGDNSISTSYLPTIFSLPDASLLGSYSSIPYLPYARSIDGSADELNLGKSGLYNEVETKIKEEPEDVKVYEEINGGRDSLAYAPPQYPWLMVTDNHSHTYRFMDSELGGQYFKNIPKSLADTRIICSNNGWLLLSKSFEEFYIYNQFACQILELPTPPRQFDEHWRIGFAECTVVSMNYGEIHFFVVGNRNWQTYLIEGDDFIHDSYHSPVFHDDSFWFLGNCGRTLGSFNVEGDTVMWKVHVVAEKGLPHSYHWMLKRYLVSCAGNLLLVVVDIIGELVDVFVLHKIKTTSSWKRVNDLGNHALYLCRSTSFSTLARAKWMNNVIFFPRVLNEDKDKIVYYSMDTGKYHSLVDQDNAVTYHDTTELLLSNWIQPSWFR